MDNLPKHIAIIMDGNGRWAKQRRLPRIAGHREGVKAVHRIVQVCANKNISVLTLFAFSSENWSRPKQEVFGLMTLFLSALQNEIKDLHNNNVRVRFIGDISRFNEKLQLWIKKVEDLTKDNTGLHLNILANYGGRWDILQTVKKIANDIANNKIQISDITESDIQKYISLADESEPDLFIRTSGEKRLSNFLLWQLAYTELYFTDVHWPDFNEEILNDALDSFAKRDRRYGSLTEQSLADV